MILSKLDVNFSICKLRDATGVDVNRDFVFFARTDEEISLVCPSDQAPQTALAVEAGWKAFRIEGVLDFGMVGVLAKISGLLAAENISIFAVSTYNTDYIFLKSDIFEKAVSLLGKNGYEFK